MKENIDNLLARYFGGNASDQDMQALDKWISLSAENQTYFDELTTLYAKLGGQESTAQKIDIERAKKSFMAYISMQQSTQAQQIIKDKHKPFYKHWIFQAASITLIFAASFTTWLIYNAEHDIVLATQTMLKQDTLPDQTEIKLSKNSKIVYSSKYGKKARKIRLEGKAFFAVGHKGNGTLQINADETFIEDIGTKFTVSAYPDSAKICVSLHEGKVHFYTTSNKGLFLSANEIGVYNKQTKQFSVVKLQKDSTTAKEARHVQIKHIQFNGKALRDVMTTIGKEYGIVIRFDQPSIGERKITVNFDGENVDMVLQVIAETLDLNVKKEANGYVISNNKNLP
jgi:ferric-dicitrate binding protein FerR (iron transport regulator)